MPTKKKPAAATGRTMRTLPLKGLIGTYADDVRAGDRDELHVERIKRAYEAGEKIPPVLVVTWPGGDYLLADGGYRQWARMKMGADLIDAEVIECADKAAAHREALRLAVGSNDHPAMGRTEDDLRAAVAAFIRAPWNEWASDREAAQAVRCHRSVVRSVRFQLCSRGLIPKDSPAHWRRRNYKEDAKTRGGYKSVEDGSTVRLLPDQSIGRAATPDDADDEGDVRPGLRGNATAPAAHVSGSAAPTNAYDADASDDTEQTCTSSPVPESPTPAPAVAGSADHEQAPAVVPLPRQPDDRQSSATNVVLTRLGECLEHVETIRSAVGSLRRQVKELTHANTSHGDFGFTLRDIAAAIGVPILNEPVRSEVGDRLIDRWEWPVADDVLKAADALARLFQEAELRAPAPGRAA